MTTHTHQTAPTQYVDAGPIRVAYRRFGKRVGVPLVFNMHFLGTMDHWDPAITDALAEDREVILFDNAGISSSSGEVPTSVEAMAGHAADFVDALGLERVDVFGFSLGGMVAQELVVQRPKLVRRLILAGTGPRGGEGMATGVTPEAQASLSIEYSEPDQLWMNAFFTQSQASQTAARAYLDRIHARTINRDPPVSERVAPAQLEALVKWGAPRKGPFDYLKRIGQPTLVVDGTKDVDIYTINSFILAQNLPNAQLILYPDANHGSHNQYPELFVAHVNLFLNGQA